MAQRESKLSRRIMDALRAEGWFCFKVHGNANTMTGLPDIMVCADGFFLGLETKNPEDRGKKNDHTAEQERVQKKIIAAGGWSQEVCSPDEAVEVVRLALRRRGL